MINNVMKEKSIDKDKLELKILDYLNSTGRIKAALLYKLENYICGQNSDISNLDLIDCIMNMLKKKIIEIIIPKCVQLKWKFLPLHNLEYFEDGNYYCRRLKNFKFSDFDDPPSFFQDYYFDSRKIDEQALLSIWIEFLKLLITKVKKIHKIITIFYPMNSNPILIGNEDPSLLNYHLGSKPMFIKKWFNKIKIKRMNPVNKKLKFSIIHQIESVSIIKAYRNKHACFYIPCIESLLYKIIQFQGNRNNINDYSNKLRELIEKFAYHCIEFVKSDYIEISEPNPYRWESISVFLPIKILKYDFINISFTGRIFKTYNQLKYCIFVQLDQKKIINKLKKLGYVEFSDENLQDKIAIGLDFRFDFPCSSISYIYFLSKYVCFYHIFLLLHHTFEYVKSTSSDIKFTEKDRNLYRCFSPVMSSLFNLKNGKITMKTHFRYNSKHLSPDQLELIYLKFLIPNILAVEKQLFKYWMLKCTLNGLN